MSNDTTQPPRESRLDTPLGVSIPSVPSPVDVMQAEVISLTNLNNDLQEQISLNLKKINENATMIKAFLLLKEDPTKQKSLFEQIQYEGWKV